MPVEGEQGDLLVARQFSFFLYDNFVRTKYSGFTVSKFTYIHTYIHVFY